MKLDQLTAAQRAYDAARRDEPPWPAAVPRISLDAAQGGKLISATTEDGVAVLVFDRGYVMLAGKSENCECDVADDVSGIESVHESVMYAAGLTTVEQAKAFRGQLRRWHNRVGRAMKALADAENVERRVARREKRPVRKAAY